MRRAWFSPLKGRRVKLNSRRSGTLSLLRPLFAAAALGLAIGAAAAPGSYTIGSAARTDVTGSTLELNCNYLNVRGELTVGNGTVRSANDVTITSGRINGGSGTINAEASWFNNGTFVAGTGTVVFSGQCATAPIRVTGNNQFCNLTLGNGQTIVFPPGRLTTVNCKLDLGSGNTLNSGGGQTAFIALGPGATVTGNAQLNNVVIGPPLPSSTRSVPTLSEYALMLLSMLLAGTAIATMRQRLPRRTNVRRRSES